ncbi:MAG: YmdB family metallophosphoesterase [Candidatus Kerfeldbacteria bacterium]|nr:YmdB family metallophosphoesterase [Candidatus Kerfeldbacteria bacterium]
MKILFLGDIVGKPGRRALQKVLPGLRRRFGVDVVIANVENLAHGKGVTRSTLQEIVVAGVDIGTGGDHLFVKPEASELLAEPSTILVRPLNIPATMPGQGQKTFTFGQKRVHVINLLGQYAMHFEPVDSLFRVMKEGLPRLPQDVDAIVVDVHAEATSEKVAMGWFLDGQVSLVVGTHTHIPTADARILPGGTGYMTDVGMVGLRDSSLGVDKDMAIARFLTDERSPFDIPEHGLVAINGLVATVTERRTTKIERIYHEIEV